MRKNALFCVLFCTSFSVTKTRRHEENQTQISQISQRNTATNLHEEILPRRALPASTGSGGRDLFGSRQAGFMRADNERCRPFPLRKIWLDMSFRVTYTSRHGQVERRYSFANHLRETRQDIRQYRGAQLAAELQVAHTEELALFGSLSRTV